MKIAILTYHRSYNYGAMLQAVATRYILSHMGHQVYFINYWPKHQSLLYKEVSIWKTIKYCLKTNPLNVLKLSYKWLWQAIRRYKYEKFISKYISKYYGNEKAEYDVLLCGSDQIWRKQPITNNYNPFYFGDNDVKANIKMSYASSMGKLPQTKEDENTIKKLLKNLDYISVREKNLCEYIKINTPYNAIQVLDPTLLLTKEQWEDCVHIKEKMFLEPYVLVYDLGQKFDKNNIKHFANRNKLKVIETIQWIDFPEQQIKPATDNPADFLCLIKNASFVLTSSFHGMALSIVFNKPFYVTSSHNIDRFKSLLQTLKLEDRWLDNCNISNLLCRTIDYNTVKQILEKEKEKSINYLSENITKKKSNGK